MDIIGILIGFMFGLFTGAIISMWKYLKETEIGF